MRRRSLVYVAAWLAATTFGVAISWAGVRGVLYTAAVAPPSPVSVPGSAAGATPSPSKEPTSASPSASPSRTTATTKPSRLTRAPATPSSGDVRSETVRGGHVALAFDHHTHQIRLVSAVPNPGWEEREFNAPGASLLRVEFRHDRNTSAVIGSWDGDQPRMWTSEN